MQKKVWESGVLKRLNGLLQRQCTLKAERNGHGEGDGQSEGEEQPGERRTANYPSRIGDREESARQFAEATISNIASSPLR